MITVPVEVGEYDIDVLEAIFEKEQDFNTQDDRDKLLIAIVRQVWEKGKKMLDEEQKE